MRIYRNVWVVLGLAAGAFVAGRWSVPLDVTRAAHADATPAAQDTDAEFAAEMKSWADAGTPGEHHAVLDRLTGEWTGEVRIWMAPDQEPIIAPTRMHREWALDGRFIREDVASDTEFGAFRGLGYTGYSNVEGVYQFLWMENHSTSIDFQSGTYDRDTKRFTTRGGYRDPHTGRYVITRSVYDISEADRHVAHSFAIDENGREYRTFEGVFVRE